MSCEKWKGLTPETIVSYRHKGVLRSYAGCVVAVCGKCKLACVWEKQAWVSRRAKDFTRRKIHISGLKDSIRDIWNNEPVFVELG